MSNAVARLFTIGGFVLGLIFVIMAVVSYSGFGYRGKALGILVVGLALLAFDGVYYVRASRRETV